MINFLVWSTEHQAFWRAHQCGYTSDVKHAGRYTFEQAKYICKQSSVGFDSFGIRNNPDELMVPAPEDIDKFEQTLKLVELKT